MRHIEPSRLRSSRSTSIAPGLLASEFRSSAARNQPHIWRTIACHPAQGITQPSPIMPQGDKSSYTDKQKRKAEHIEDSYRKRGVNKGEAEERAWRTVNKQDGGAKKKTSSN